MALLTAPHWEAVTGSMRTLLVWFGRQQTSERFYQAGGTALALLLGHRRSIVLDFFSESDEIHSQSRSELIHLFSARAARVVENADGNLILLTDGLHAGFFFSYGHPLLEPPVAVEQIRLASLLDVGLMKLDTLIGRGSRKDFYDLYAITQQIPLKELLQAGARKYPAVRDFGLMAVESLVLFDNADRDSQPDLLVDLPWERVKQFFLEQGRAIGLGWIGG